MLQKIRESNEDTQYEGNEEALCRPKLKRKAPCQDRDGTHIDAHIPLPKITREQKAEGEPGNQSSGKTDTTKHHCMQIQVTNEGGDNLRVQQENSHIGHSSSSSYERPRLLTWQTQTQGTNDGKGVHHVQGENSCNRLSSDSIFAMPLTRTQSARKQPSLVLPNHAAGVRSGPQLRIGSHQGVSKQGNDMNSSREHSSSLSFGPPSSMRQAMGLPSHKGSSAGNERGGTCNASTRTGSSTRATSTPTIQGGNSTRGGCTVAKQPKNLPKCEYCRAKQKKGGEIFHQQPLLVSRCPAYANLSSSDYFCSSCTSYLHKLFTTRRT